MTICPKPPQPSKRNDLQVIRGIAILSVLGFHFHPKTFPNGYLGVDQFFVLSGFLMCMLLTGSQKLPIFNLFTEFYIRRFRRILPLYFLFILNTVMALYTVFPDTAAYLNQLSAKKALLFLSNRPHTQDEDYFEKLSFAMDLFTHTWSLSVEIQFYLIAPIIFLFGHQLKGASKYGYYSTLATISFMFHIFSSPTTSFNSVFARIWQFLMGMMAYFWVKNRTVPFAKNVDLEHERKPDKIFKILLKYFILTLTIAIVIIPKELDPILARPLMTVSTGTLVLLEVQDWILNSRFLTYLGDISYVLYLVHWPVYAYIRLNFQPNFWILNGALLLSILLAILVHETYEKWYLKQSNMVIGVLVMVLFFSSAFLIYLDEFKESMQGYKEVLGTDQRKFPSLDGVTANMSFDDAERMNLYWNKHDHMAPELQEPNCIKRYPSHYWCDFKENGTEFKIALLGNSYVKNHHKMIVQECKHRATMISMADETGCEPLAAPRRPVDNGKFSSSWTAACNQKLVEFVDFLNETQPDYAFILTRWYAVAEPYDLNSTDLSNDTIYLEMKSQLSKMLPNIKKKLFILDSFPRVIPERIEHIAKEMKAGRKTMEEINNSLYDPRHFERGRNRHAQLLKNLPECRSKCELIDYMDAFWNKTMNAFQYFDSRGFSFFTSPFHLSAHGIEHVRPIYSRICKGL